MRRKRLFAAIAVAAMCAPGTWLRTDVPQGVPTDIALAQVAGPSDTPNPAWRVERVWEYSAGVSRRFGGYSALLALDTNTLRAFSDRGFRFTFTAPDSREDRPEDRKVARQIAGKEPVHGMLTDIESATRDPETGDYWLGYEAIHAIHRFSFDDEPRGLLPLDNGAIEWSDNSGIEAMLRLSDGRFVAIPERRSYAMIYPSDPVEGAAEQRISLANPADDFAVTDLAQLPDGRVLFLMRALAWGVPPFTSLLAIADAPPSDNSEPWRPQVALRLDDVLPPENYEGLAVREQDDGSIAVWIISDDNISVMQRTLLAKLVFDPRQSSD